MAELTDTFEPTFARWARRVRGRLRAGWVLGGLAVGLALGVAGAGLAWWQRLGWLRPWGAALGVAGALAGLLVASRRRWPDSHVALYLDRQLGTDERIVTAIDLRGGDHPAGETVARQALEALSGEPHKGLGPRVWRPYQLLSLVAVAGIAAISLAALPPAPAPPPRPPGSDLVKLDGLPGLKKVIELEQLDPIDAEQRKRLQQLARRARELDAKLKEGMPRRDAQSELAKLRSDVAAERQRLGSGERRRGLEAALGKLAKNEQLDKARRALGDRDLTRFDEEMAKLANKLEAADRQKAIQALEEAAEAARKSGAPDVAKALEEQKRLLQQRAREAEKLRALANAFGEGLSKEAREALNQMGKTGSSAAQRKLAEELAKALGKLTDAERKKLAEKLKEQAQGIDPDTSTMRQMTKEEIAEMLKQLSTPEGQKKLAEQLKELANQPQGSKSSERQRQLGQAEKGLGDAQKQLVPMPMPMSGQPGPGQGPPGQGPPGASSGDGTGGPGPGGGKGNHDGKTAPVGSAGLRARADARLNPGAPNPGVAMGRTPGGKPEDARTPGSGAVGTAAPVDVSGMDGSDIPEEYREHVRRYNQPR